MNDSNGKDPGGTFRVALRPGWWLDGDDADGGIPLKDVLALLAAIDATGNIAGAGRACGLSYRHAWGVLRRFEALFGVPLLVTHRRQGTELTPFAQRLLWANRRIEARLMPMLDSLASELQEELQRLLPEGKPHLRLHASHGFAVEALMQHMQGHAPGLELRYRTASEALAALDAGECDLAGFQVPLGEFEPSMLAHYRPWLHRDDHLLVHLAVRNTGLFVPAGNPKGIHGMADLARPDVRFVNRQTGSSTRLLIELMLRRLDIPVARVQGYENSEFTHMAVAAHIASGMADTGIGVETAAHRFGLDFVALARERYFFALRKDTIEQPAMRALLGVMRGSGYRDFIGQLVGYDASETGKIQTLKEAFG
ncbi:substrate-binding domain-containing protein [Achromobacter aloeverae]|uniref:LysR family transcriptional regulator n=1 Tax=Achromobacter aloeverae TaxID=1750518 RepID=A0A4Q1HPX8_9BURK|nr:substrate-binding domain-containing protein [Achromobacter aloeverae]RXN92603.1 LysR family transcriptional regulator [Achromobacter aloeverae]